MFPDRIRVLLVLSVLGVCAVTCTRDSLSAECDSTTRGLIPLTQLTGTYLGEPGGLYPGGSNLAPASHDSVGLHLASSFVALDTLGVPSSTGSWVLLSVGMSNCTQEFSQFILDVAGDITLHPNLRIVDGAQGGQTAAKIKYDTATFWQVIDVRLHAAGLTPLQVQAIWLKEANAGPTSPFPGHAVTLRDDLRDVVQVAKQKYLNLKQIFMSSRVYAGYASTALNPEPYAYESAFSVRWLIESQINGLDSLNYDSSAGVVSAPWLAWGPYLYADGEIPRDSDSLQWFCSDFVSDGTHPSTSGRMKVSQLLEEFFKTSPYTVPWFLLPTAPVCTCDCHADPFCDGGQLNVQDVVATISVAFRGMTSPPDPSPTCPKERTDVDCSSTTDVVDVVKIVNVAFRGVNPATEFCDPCP